MLCMLRSHCPKLPQTCFDSFNLSAPVAITKHNAARATIIIIFRIEHRAMTDAPGDPGSILQLSIVADLGSVV
jgi:hypothetical protein